MRYMHRHIFSCGNVIVWCELSKTPRMCNLLRLLHSPLLPLVTPLLILPSLSGVPDDACVMGCSQGGTGSRLARSRCYADVALMLDLRKLVHFVRIFADAFCLVSNNVAI